MGFDCTKSDFAILHWLRPPPLIQCSTITLPVMNCRKMEVTLPLLRWTFATLLVITLRTVSAAADVSLRRMCPAGCKCSCGVLDDYCNTLNVNCGSDSEKYARLTEKLDVEMFWVQLDSLLSSHLTYCHLSALYSFNFNTPMKHFPLFCPLTALEKLENLRDNCRTNLTTVATARIVNTPLQHVPLFICRLTTLEKLYINNIRLDRLPNIYLYSP